MIYLLSKVISNSFVLILAVVILSLSCNPSNKENKGLGTIHIDVTGEKAAIPHFEKGLLLLHSFEYKDSREAFLKAQEIDPLMAMAYWGEAMTYNHPLWREQDYERGIAALSRLKLADENITVSGLENDFIQSVGILYSDEPSKIKRDKNYADFMGKLTEKYPKNHEVASFYSLALLGSVPMGRDDNIYGHAAIVAQHILDENPKHPGALHYLIHSYDDPEHAHLAKNAADNYSIVAPQAGHALHMPSHIYVALGLWDNVVASNEHSYQASLDRMERKQLNNDARGYHAFHWLEYGYLQQDRIEDARKMVVDMEKYANETPSKRGRVHLVYLKGTFLVETEQWGDPIANITVDVTDLNIANRSQYNFLEGMIAFTKQDKGKLDIIIENMKADYELESLSLVDTNITVCTSQTREEAIQSDIDESEAMAMQLMALSSWLEKDMENAEHWFLRSMEKEENLSYSFGPPFIQKPSHELYADWLMENDRFEEAITHYKQTLKRAPNRVMALKGIEKANSLINQRIAMKSS